jgi:hypothetical protein
MTEPVEEPAAEPLYIKNPDGSYMSNEEVAQHVYSTLSNESYLAVLKMPKKEDMIELHFYAGMGIRNNYGMWREDNPHSIVNPEPNAEGLLDDPNHPDQRSHEVLKMVWEKVH